LPTSKATTTSASTSNVGRAIAVYQAS
jgi:hypothetical protein